MTDPVEEKELIKMIAEASNNTTVSRETRFDDLGIDSIDLLELILSMEARLNVRLRSEGLDEKVLETCGSLVDYVRRQRQ